MLRLPPFRLLRPESLPQAAEMLAEEVRAGGSVRLVAGGTDVWPGLKRHQVPAGTIVSLRSVDELHGIEIIDGGELRLGATTTLAQLLKSGLVEERFPVLHRATASISAPALRNLGTVGGNLCLDTRCSYFNQSEAWRQAVGYCKKRAGSTCWVAPSSKRCWAVAAGDLAPVLCALGARVRLVAANGERTIPVADLYRDDGIDYLASRRDEILTDVLLPPESDARHCRSAFLKLRRRGAIDFAALSVATSVWIRDDQVERASVFLGAVASRPLRVGEAEETLIGRPLEEHTIDDAARLCRRAATPLDNSDFTAQWRSRSVQRYAAAALRECSSPPRSG